MLGRTYSEAALHERIVMTLEERDQLQVFLRQLLVARASPKDVAAETLIKQACAQQSDALYLLVQRAMGSDLALQLAMAKNAELQAKLDQVSVAPHTNTAQSQATRTSLPQTATPSLWGSGMVGSIASTAVGVVAGSFLFQGIQNIMELSEPSHVNAAPLDSVADDAFDLGGDDWA
jgi:hypothetical protein